MSFDNAFNVDELVAAINKANAGMTESVNKAIQDALLVPGVITGIAPSTDPGQLGTDAVGVAQSFVRSENALQSVDVNQPDRKWQPEWHTLSDTYARLLRETTTLATLAYQYLNDFKKNVSDQFNVDEAQWEANRALVAAFSKDPRGDEIKTSSASTSQGFTDLRRLVEAFKTQFSEFEAGQRKDYDARSDKLQRDMQNLQADIAGHQSTAAKLERGIKQILGINPLFSWLISEILGGLGVTSADDARRALDVTYREEAELRDKKNAVDREAVDVNNRRALLQQVQQALAVLVNDVTDIASRLNRFAQTWSDTHHDISLLEANMSSTSDSASKRVLVLTDPFQSFASRVKILGESTIALSAAMNTYVTAVNMPSVAPPFFERM
ncbi:hypothetical protein FPV67DRAFT_1447826 [Lyophyllum atratum]|nr:hypothetical protein FPV67DRAFT_1447826 [Lyophyllum atratum]